MSYQFVKFFSMGLVRNGEFHMYLPPKKAGFFMKDNPNYQRPTKTLILLHGFNGDCDDWPADALWYVGTINDAYRKMKKIKRG